MPTFVYPPTPLTLPTCTFLRAPKPRTLAAYACPQALLSFKPKNVHDFGEMLDPAALLFLWIFCLITFFTGIWQMSKVMNEPSTISFGYNRCGQGGSGAGRGVQVRAGGAGVGRGSNSVGYKRCGRLLGAAGGARAGGGTF